MRNLSSTWSSGSAVQQSQQRCSMGNGSRRSKSTSRYDDHDIEVSEGTVCERGRTRERGANRDVSRASSMDFIRKVPVSPFCRDDEDQHHDSVERERLNQTLRATNRDRQPLQDLFSNSSHCRSSSVNSPVSSLSPVSFPVKRNSNQPVLDTHIPKHYVKNIARFFQQDCCSGNRPSSDVLDSKENVVLVGLIDSCGSFGKQQKSPEADNQLTYVGMDLKQKDYGYGSGSGSDGRDTQSSDSDELVLDSSTDEHAPSNIADPDLQTLLGNVNCDNKPNNGKEHYSDTESSPDMTARHAMPASVATGKDRNMQVESSSLLQRNKTSFDTGSEFGASSDKDILVSRSSDSVGLSTTILSSGLERSSSGATSSSSELVRSGSGATTSSGGLSDSSDCGPSAGNGPSQAYPRSRRRSYLLDSMQLSFYTGGGNQSSSEDSVSMPVPKSALTPQRHDTKTNGCNAFSTMDVSSSGCSSDDSGGYIGGRVGQSWVGGYASHQTSDTSTLRSHVHTNGCYGHHGATDSKYPVPEPGHSAISASLPVIPGSTSLPRLSEIDMAQSDMSLNPRDPKILLRSAHLSNELVRLSQLLDSLNPVELQQFLQKRLHQRDSKAIIALGVVLPRSTFPPQEHVHCVRCHKNYNPRLNSACTLKHPAAYVVKTRQDGRGASFYCKACDGQFALQGLQFYDEKVNSHMAGFCFNGQHSTNPAYVNYSGIIKTCEEYGCVECYV